MNCFSVPMSLFGRGLAACLVLATAASWGAPPVLRWNPSSTNLWNASATNWLNESGAAVAWQPGAEARFEGAGGLVNVAADLVVSNITFAGSGYALLGAGRLCAEGALSAAAATTNSVAASLTTVAGLSKTGTGALALARCSGPLSVQAGTLLASGSLLADADLAVASGAKLITLGDPDAASNLIANPSFETSALAAGAWAYVSNGASIENWTVTAYTDHIGLQNTAAAGSPWNSQGTSPDGAQMLIIQYDGAVQQTFAVPADGVYSLAFSYLLRSGFGETLLYVSLDGLPLATLLNQCAESSPGRFASGALCLKAGSHTLGFSGEGHWGDLATMVDAVCLAAPSGANAGRAFGGDSILRVVTGASVALNHSGALALAKVSVNGTAASGTFTSSHASLIFSGSGSLTCAHPEYVFEGKGLPGDWSSASLWADGAAPAAGGGQGLRLFFPSAASTAVTNGLSGTFFANRLRATGAAAADSFALAGNAIALTNDAGGVYPKISLPVPGAWTVQAPVTAWRSLTLDIAGSLTFANNTLTLPNSSGLFKYGPGTVALPALTNASSAYIQEGALQTPSLPSGSTAQIRSQADKSAAFYLTQGGVTIGNALYLMGSGSPTLGTRCGGGTVTCSNWTYGYGDSATFDVGAGDTLSILQLLLNNNTLGYSVTSLTKTGPGALEIRAAGADGDKNRAYQGATTLRNGTLILSEDDFGTLSGVTNPFNGRTYGGTGGSLGYSAFTNAVAIGDGGTASTNSLALIANGNGRYIGHNLEVFNRGASVTLGMTTGTVLFAGTLTLHRDVTLSGPANGVMSFSNIVAAADFSGSGLPTLSGLGGLRFEGSVPSGLSLVLGARSLRFGSGVVRAAALNALSLGAATAASLDVDFASGANDTIAATSLVLSNTAVNLYYAASGLPFAEPGTYTLFTYSGTLGGSASMLGVGNPQPGVTYAFSNDTANARVRLTVTGTSGDASAVWKNSSGGAWGTGSNWDDGSVPGGTGVVPLFGLAIASPATVTLDATRTVGGLTFNNPSYGYTLSGGALSFDRSGSTPTVSVLSGTHAINTAMSSTSSLSVSNATDAVLAFGGSAVANTAVALAAGTLELQGSAAVSGAAALGASATLRATGAATSVGTLSGAASSAIELSGSAAKLTVNQSADATFSGVLKGGAGAAFEKAGSGLLTLSNAGSTFSGLTTLSGGSLALQTAALPGALSVGASSLVSVQVPAANGLMGYYYSVSPDTNNFWTLSGMEAHFAGLAPDLAAVSSLAGTTFDFGATGALFPLPYGSSGSRANSFEAVWRGTITVPESGTYTFGLNADDGVILAIDGQTVLARNRYVSDWTDALISLTAGRHSIVIGYFQLSGGVFLQARVRTPSATTPVMLPNSWLTPYSTVGRPTGSGSVSLAASNALLRAAGATFATYKGGLTGPANTLVAKGGSGALLLSGGGADAFAGDLYAQAGALLLGATESIGNASLLRVEPGASLAVGNTETVGALAGGGTLWVGGTIYVTPFTDESDCDVSTSKTYTHLVDFPLGTTAPVVNGVTFGNTGAWSFTAGTAPSGAWNDSPADTTRTGIDSLLWDFQYNSTDYTLTLSGLTPNKVYELRLYFRNFANNPRNLTFTFTAGSTPIGSYDYNPDSVTRSILGCRYTADAAGTLSMRVVSHVPTDTAHLYGFSNEEVSGATASATLTLSPAAGVTHRFTGNVFGSGTLVKSGAGTQTLGGTNALANPLQVSAGTLSLEASAALPAGAAVASGATLEASRGGATLGGLTGQGTLALGDSPTNSGPYFVAITGDADCGISASKVYTHRLDFGSNGNKAIVNGVAFYKVTAGSGSIVGYGWSGFPDITHPGGNDSGIGIASSQGIYNLIYDMNYNLRNGTVYLTGLTTGKWYEVRFYNRKWEPNGMNRSQTFTFDPDGSGPISDTITFNPDATPAGVPNDNFLGYRYLAATNVLAVTVASATADTYHFYGLSNEETSDTLGNPVVLNIAGNCVFDGAVTGLGGLAKTGAGTLTFTGASTATGPLAIRAGAFGVASGGRATSGPVTVAAGATLFGSGTVGGTVSVASNAWLQAGTAAACGTLQIGGGLAIAPGANLPWRYTGTAYDSFSVAGTVTLPTNGVLQTSALAAGAKPPAKAVLFASDQVISGPATFSGWTITGLDNVTARLVYSDDRKTVYFKCPRGSLMLLR